MQSTIVQVLSKIIQSAFKELSNLEFSIVLRVVVYLKTKAITAIESVESIKLTKSIKSFTAVSVIMAITTIMVITTIKSIKSNRILIEKIGYKYFHTVKK